MPRPALYDEPTVTLAVRVPRSLKAAVTYAAVTSSASLTEYVIGALAGQLAQGGHGDLVPDLSRTPRPGPGWTEADVERWEERQAFEAWRAAGSPTAGNGHAPAL